MGNCNCNRGTEVPNYYFIITIQLSNISEHLPPWAAVIPYSPKSSTDYIIKTQISRQACLP